jgi:hypothetical protein
MRIFCMMDFWPFLTIFHFFCEKSIIFPFFSFFQSRFL